MTTKAADGDGGSRKCSGRKRRGRIRRPAVDVREASGSWIVLADVPGASAPDLRLTVEGSRLKLVAPARDPFAEGETVHRVKWKRSFELPPTVDLESISARLADGLLRIELPRAASPEARQIEVTGA